MSIKPSLPTIAARHALLLLSVATIMVSAAPLAAQATFPKLDIPEQVLELDPVVRGNKTSATFKVNNTGQGTLEILGARTSCPCATLDYPETIKPGESGTVTVTIDTLKLSGPTKVNVFLNTNDPDNPNPQLRANVDSEDALAANPGSYRYLVYQNFEGEAVIVQTVLALDNKDIKITKIESPYDFLTFGEPRPATDQERVTGYSGTQWSFEAKLANTPPVGALTGSVMVYTDHPDQQVIPIPVSGFVRPLAAATPHVVDFGRFTMPESGTYLETHLKQFAEELFDITRIEADVAGISGETVDIVEGREWTVRVIATPQLAQGAFKGTLTLHTNHPRQKTITVPIKGNRAPASDD